VPHDLATATVAEPDASIGANESAMWYTARMTVGDRILSILGLGPKRGKAAPRLADLVHRGLPVAAFDAVASHTHLTREALAKACAIPLRTIQRRAVSGARRFERDESDRLMRVARLYAFAEDVLGSRDAAETWMGTPNRALDGARPVDELETEIAAREVEDALGRIRHGIFA
jgi:putative toxin-antitoxin system antitoxin component (TIGR02293 family)